VCQQQGLFDLTGKTALVTGSTRGLGRAMAEGIAAAGARVILNGSNLDRLEEAVADFKLKGFDAHRAHFSVTDPDEIAAAAIKIHAQFPSIDILVNNAGINLRGRLEEFSDHDWHQVMTLNVHSAFYVSREFVKPMIMRRSGKIINTCSLLSEVCRQHVAPYSASKGALKMLTKAMAVEWGGYNIQTNGIGPGYFVTEMTQALKDDPEFTAWLCKRTPANRWGAPAELQGTVVYLSSRASDFVNGQIIYVDGGLLAGI
jgi:gluconate 5-dehydrogenase